MKQHIEIIDGQEVVVKVYAPSPAPKKLTVKTKPKLSTKRRIAKWRKQNAK